MKKRSDYRIVKYQFDERPNYFQYRVDQKFLWLFWVTPDDDGILAHWVRYSCENYRRAKRFSTVEYAEESIARSLAWRKASSIEEVVG